jgi:hypothetical protein
MGVWSLNFLYVHLLEAKFSHSNIVQAAGVLMIILVILQTWWYPYAGNDSAINV